MRALLRDFSLSAAVAGFIATVISYAGPLVIIFQAADAAHLSREVLSSWVWAISIGSALLGIGLSLRYRVPVIIAWLAMMAATMAVPGGCVAVVNAGGVMANNVSGRGLLPRERRTPPPSSARATLSERDLPRERLFQKSGNAIARANHARMQ